MNAQEYLETILEECKLYSSKSKQDRESYSKLFPDSSSSTDVEKILTEMSDTDLYDYFKASQGLLDNQIIFSKIASFIYFCKYIDIELDVSKVSEIPQLTEYLTSHEPFNTEFVIDENTLKEKNAKRFEEKFKLFKQSLGVAIQLAK